MNSVWGISENAQYDLCQLISRYVMQAWTNYIVTYSVRAGGSDNVLDPTKLKR